jgi:hypothetical protein
METAIMMTLQMIITVGSIAAAVVLTGQQHLKLKGGVRFLAGFGIYSVLNLATGFVVGFALAVGGVL